MHDHFIEALPNASQASTVGAHDCYSDPLSQTSAGLPGVSCPTIYIGHVEQWPNWAKHIKQVEVRPPGEVGPKTE